MSNLTNNTAQLELLLAKVNALPEAGTNLPELDNEGTAAELFSGKQLIDGDGNIVEGTFTINNEINTQVDLVAQIQSALIGKGGSGGEQATPEISVDSSNGLVTATAGTKTSTYQLAFQPAKTITPTTTTQVAVSSGYYTGGNITVAGDANLVASNIKSGVSIFGVNGTLTGEGGFAENYEDEILNGTLANYTNNTVTTLRKDAFYDHDGLKTVTFTACSQMGQSAFAGCANLTTAVFPICISVASSAFQACGKLSSVSFPLCKSIYWLGMSGCSNLTNIDLPECTYLGGRAFQNCSKLATVSLPMCKYIYSSTFQSCKSLATVSLPNITTIGSTAFGSCTKLTTFYLTGSTLCTLSNSNAFTGTGITSTAGSIYVNASLVDAYKAATNWTYFSNIIYAAE